MQDLFTEEKIFAVSELTALIKQDLENRFSDITLIGELSNFKKHVSGHWYFTLKDSNAQISCVMWRGINAYVFFSPQDGMKVVLKGRITVYPPRGNYQMEVRSMRPAGVGELQEAFEKLKKKLSAEGLFDQVHKKAIPRFPEKIGIVTAIGGAALKDMISVAERRYPLAELVIAPAKVQGEGGAAEIVSSIKKLNNRDDIDVIIVGRGGGSLEDLWQFNEEIVARAIFDSVIPVVSGVGHETDVTIADYTADLRAPTPTAAMELATPDINEIIAFITDFSYNSTNEISGIIRKHKDIIKNMTGSYVFRKPWNLVSLNTQKLDNLFFRLNNSALSKVKTHRHNLELINQNIESYNFAGILKRGYTIIRQKGKIIPRSEILESDESVDIQFFDKEVRIG